MADTSRFIGALKSRSGWLKETGKTIVSAFAVLVIIIIGYLAWHHFTQTKKGTHISSPSEVETANKNSNESFLKNNDISSYQISQQTLAQQYLLNNDPNSAERVILEVINKVPASKITSGTYMVIVSAEKMKNDKTQYKMYLRLLIAKLKQEGKTALAAEYQTELDKQ